jgi:1-deoxy-D-xylulose-5-phosphate reductoisomerase
VTRRRIAILGSTGSIGTQALDIVRAHPDRFEVVALAAGRNVELILAQAAEFGVSRVALADRDAGARGAGLASTGVTVTGGPEAVVAIAAGADVDIVLNGITGAAGLRSTLAALQAGTPVALANKESLIVGGDLVVAAAERAGSRETHLIAVDSEHSALAQCLRSGTAIEVGRLVLTASGGPFRGRSRDSLHEVTVEAALAHPTWEMGRVISINSATLINKGLELIEAHLLFDVPWDNLDVVVHPQSIVHSMVEFIDGSTIAQLTPPDMRLPIQLALAWPERLGHAPTAMDWSVASTLSFEPPDREAFPALDLAEAAGRRRGTHPAVLNAANEQAVDAFLGGRLPFLGIADIVGQVLGDHSGGNVRDLDDVVEADRWARQRADELLLR